MNIIQQQIKQTSSSSNVLEIDFEEFVSETTRGIGWCTRFSFN